MKDFRSLKEGFIMEILERFLTDVFWSRVTVSAPYFFAGSAKQKKYDTFISSLLPSSPAIPQRGLLRQRGPLKKTRRKYTSGE